jgi:hypothetical protein
MRNRPHTPNLFRTEKDAVRLYQLYLNRLQMNGLDEETVTACAEIRRHATRTVGAKEALFTYGYAIESLCRLRRYKAAWWQLREREKLHLGARLDLSQRDWAGYDACELMWRYAPLLYLLRRFELGCALQEKALACFFSGKVRSYDVLPYVYKPESRPRECHHVSLRHFYDRLGRDLRGWQHWESFVSGFHPRLYRMAAVERDELLHDPQRLADFSDRLAELAKARITSSVTRGQADLVQSAERVGRAQQSIRKQLDEFQVRIQPTIERTDKKLKRLFPELRGLKR